MQLASLSSGMFVLRMCILQTLRFLPFCGRQGREAPKVCVKQYLITVLVLWEHKAPTTRFLKEGHRAVAKRNCGDFLVVIGESQRVNFGFRRACEAKNVNDCVQQFVFVELFRDFCYSECCLVPTRAGQDGHPVSFHRAFCHLLRCILCQILKLEIENLS